MLRRSSRFAPIIATLALASAPAVTGRVRSLRSIATLSTALTMGMSFAHTLELPGKMKYEGKLWWHLSRTLYRPWWGRAGYVEGLALCSGPGLAYLVRDRHPALPLTLGAVSCLLLANPVVFFTCVQPANSATLHTTPDELPPNWAELRNRWEYGHALRFALHLAALCALIASVVAETPTELPRNRRPGGRRRAIDTLAVSPSSSRAWCGTAVACVALGVWALAARGEPLGPIWSSAARCSTSSG